MSEDTTGATGPNSGAGYDTSNYEHEPRILIFDIECTPFTAYSWGPKFNVNLIDYIEPWHLLCFAYKWYGEDETHVVSQRQFTSAYSKSRKDDRQVAKAMWDLFDEADILIGHNGDKFDIKKTNARFAIHGLGRPSPYKTVDTCKVARRSFNFGSNSLNDLGKFLGLGQKLSHTGFSLWTGCMAGDEDAWQMMEDYNIQDVVLLEQLYEKFLYEGWIVNHPDLTALSGETQGCPSCLSTSRQKRGFYSSGAFRYQQYQCKNCKGYYRNSDAEPGSRSTYRKV